MKRCLRKKRGSFQDARPTLGSEKCHLPLPEPSRWFRAFRGATPQAYTPRRNPGGAVARQSGPGVMTEDSGFRRSSTDSNIDRRGYRTESREGVPEPYNVVRFWTKSRIAFPVAICSADTSVDELKSDRNNGPLVSAAQHERRPDRWAAQEGGVTGAGLHLISTIRAIRAARRGGNLDRRSIEARIGKLDRLDSFKCYRNIAGVQLGMRWQGFSMPRISR